MIFRACWRRRESNRTLAKEAGAATLDGHPHFMMPDSSIEMVELMPVPGM